MRERVHITDGRPHIRGNDTADTNCTTSNKPMRMS
jgi:hypothetical protein